MKRIVSTVLVFAMIALGMLTSVNAITCDDTFTLGDVNDDGDINALDSLVLKQSIMGLTDNCINRDASDFTADGEINSRDVFYLKGCLSGLLDVANFENNNPIYKLEIGEVDISKFSIVVPDDTDENDAVYTAAVNLKKAIENASGAYLRVTINHDEANVIEFHVVELGTEINGYTIDTIEDYYYTVGEGRIDIYGSRYRGCIYASYEIIQDYLGFVYYSMDDVLVYKNRVIKIESGTESYHSMNSSFSYRFVLQNLFEPGTRQGAKNYYLPAKCNGYQIGAWSQDKYGTLTGPLGFNAHSFEGYHQMGTGYVLDKENSDDLEILNARIEAETQKYINTGTPVDQEKIEKYVTLAYKYQTGTNPNSKNDWQPCMTDEAEYNLLFGGMLDYIEMLQSERNNLNILRNDLGNSYFSFSISDNGSYCTCRICAAIRSGKRIKMAASQIEGLSKWYSGNYTVSGNYVTFEKESDSGLSINIANRAANDVQDYYPGTKIYMILYDQTLPSSVLPDENIVLMLCGHGCYNHKLTETCTDVSPLGGNNETFKKDIVTWCGIADRTGCLIYYWDYPIQNGYALSDCPNILNIYYDYKWLFEAGVDGIYYEGESSGTLQYVFENAKAYMATKMLWDPEMSYDQYISYLKEYLYITYGDGYENIYQYILMDDESGNENPCFVNNHDRPFDEHSSKYLNENYEEMRSLVVSALELAESSKQKRQCEYLLMITDFLGLSASYERMYTNGDTESRKLYEQRYTDMYNYMASIDVWVWDSGEVYELPDEIDFDINPMIQFYSIASWRWGNDCLTNIN